MSTIGQEISTIRNLIKEVTDDSIYTDSFLYDVWKKARADVMKNQRTLSRFDWQIFCVKLEKDKWRKNCADCGEDECYRMMSGEIPNGASLSGSEAIQVMTRDGQILSHRDPFSLNSDQYDPARRGRASFTFENRRIVLHNARYKMVYVRTLPEDPADWVDIQYCEDDTIPCKDLFEMDAGIPQEYSMQVMKNIAFLLNIPLQVQEDTHADRNAEIKQ